MEEVESENWRPSLIRRMDARKELLKLALGNDGDEADFQTHVVPPQEDSRRARAKLFKRRNVLFEKFLDTCDRKLKKLEKHGRLPKTVPRASMEERSKKTTRSVRASRRAVQPVTRKRGDKGVFKKPKLPTPKNRAAQKLSKRARATRADPSDYRAVAAAALERLKKRLATKAPRKAPRAPKAAIVPSEAASLKEEVCRNSIVEVVGAGEDPAARPNEACFIKEEVECTEFEAVDDEPVGSEPVLSRAADIEPIFTKEGLCVHCKSHGMAKRLPHTADDCPYLQCHCTQCIAAVCLYEEEKALETVAVSDRFSTIFTLADLKN
ncbi:hypothetical protein AAVH_11767 [Aphelenchoides avenae]|nr:hypothetical protein AAVH_11767 [Aphelenchus avenae]